MKENMKIIAFLCNWCSYAGADLAGTSRMQYPANIRIIRVPCSGRINPVYIIKALMEGADGVMVSGCHPGDCHYLSGNLYARRRFVVLKKLLRTCGFNPDRVQFTWVSASEGGRFAEVVGEVTENVRKLGPNPLRKQMRKEDVPYASPDTCPTETTASPVADEPCADAAPPAGGKTDLYRGMTEQIRAHAAKLLEDQTVETVLAYTSGGVDGMKIPFFAKEPEETARIEWDDRCCPNLAPYLPGLGKKVAILAKACDARAIVQYLTERQIKREDVYIIGVDCAGMVTETGVARPGCDACETRTPPLYDVLIEDGFAGTTQKEPSPSDDIPAPLSAQEQSLAESFDRFQAEIDKCILCYSCRQVCYGCYCKTCFIERDQPDWQPADIDAGTKMTFHIGRFMHLAGRCTGCGACEAACQSGVNLRYIIKEVTRFIKETYGYEAGMDAEEQPALLANSFDDREIGFLGGEPHA